MDEIQCTKAALDYCKQHLETDIMSTPLKAFKAARLFDPYYHNKVKSQSVALTTLSVFLFVTELLLSNLKQEFPLYFAAVKGISSNCKTASSNIPRTFQHGR